jgi:hypothetical protein
MDDGCYPSRSLAAATFKNCSKRKQGFEDHTKIVINQMVHGGGHHSGGGWGGGSSSWSGGGRHQHHHGWERNRGTNVVVVNSNPGWWGGGWGGFGGWNSSYQQAHVYHHVDRQASGDEMFEERCEECCKKACMCSTCCVAAETVRETRSSRACRPGCFFIFAAIVLFAILLATSHVEDDWTLNAGESRHIKIPALDKRVFVSSNIPQSTMIYAIDGACPPLTGPKVTLSNSMNIELAQGDYQYDYFYLNKGSSIEVTLNQNKGATNLLILRGLDNIENKSENDGPDAFIRKAVLKRYAGAGQTAHLQYVVPESDTFVVVYDNASNSKGQISISYDVELTTFDLKGKTTIPLSWCDSSRCTIDTAKNHGCILVKAQVELTLYVRASRKWGMIFLYSVIPLLVGLWCNRKTGVSQQAEEFETGPSAGDFEYPSATAPHGNHVNQQAGLPPASTTPLSTEIRAEPVPVQPVIAIPASNVYPVACELPSPMQIPSAPFDTKM